MAKKITIEILAGMVQRGFERIDKRLISVEVELVEIKEEIRQMRAEISRIWDKLDELEKKMEKISKNSKEDVDAMAVDIVNLKQRVEFLENQIKAIQKR